jgi:hypothetical protein
MRGQPGLMVICVIAFSMGARLLDAQSAHRHPIIADAVYNASMAIAFPPGHRRPEPPSKRWEAGLPLNIAFNPSGRYRWIFWSSARATSTSGLCSRLWECL